MKILLNILIVCVFSFGQVLEASAQKAPKKNKQIEAVKMGFIAGRLQLSADEAKAFWPVYTQYQTEYNQLLVEKRKNRAANINNAEKAVDDDFYYDTKLLELKKSYRNNFRKILPAEKLKKLYQAERDFREELIKQLKNRKNAN